MLCLPLFLLKKGARNARGIITAAFAAGGRGAEPKGLGPGRRLLRRLPNAAVIMPLMPWLRP